MATLTETAYMTRKSVKWGAIGLFVFILLRIGFFMALDWYRQTFPPPPLVPNYAFGKLPRIVFPENPASPAGEMKFRLQTIEGNVSQASEAAYVFFMPKTRSNLLSLSKAQSFVEPLGFTATPKQISNTVYRFIDLKYPLRTIDIDTVSNHFEFRYAYADDLTLFEAKNVPSPIQATAEVESFFQKLGLEIGDLNIDKPAITYLKLVGDQLEPTTSQSQAVAVKVSVFRKNYLGVKMLTDNPQEANVTFILSGSENQAKRILYVKFRHWPLDAKTTGIYELKTSDVAWEELKTGQGYIASYPKKNQIITVTEINLAYYDSENPQLYLQPVFVFEGEDNFLGYVAAVAPPWTE